MKKKVVIYLIAAVVLLAVGMSLGKTITPVATSTAGKASIGVIEVNGIIAGDAAANLFSGTTGASSGQIMKNIRMAAERDDIKAVILRINSRGEQPLLHRKLPLNLIVLKKQANQSLLP